MLKHKKILLAGRSGFVGSRLFYGLKDNHKIFALGNSRKCMEDNFFQVNLTRKIDVDSFVRELPKCDILIFLVGLAHKKGKNKELSKFRLINKETLVNLVSSLEEKNKLPSKIIFASTISVYGEKMNQSVYDEQSFKEPISPYAVTKLESEAFLKNNYRTKSWILRFAPVYSPDFQINIKRRTKFIFSAYRIGSGAKKLSLCNIKNINLAIDGILNDKVPPGVYNVSDKVQYSYNDLLGYVKSKRTLTVPPTLIKILYYLGKISGNYFIIENAIKLISDNVYPSNKIRQYVDLSFKLGNYK